MKIVGWKRVLGRQGGWKCGRCANGIGKHGCYTRTEQVDEFRGNDKVEIVCPDCMEKLVNTAMKMMEVQR